MFRLLPKLTLLVSVTLQAERTSMTGNVHLQLHVVLGASLQTPGVDAQSGQTTAVDQNVENRFRILIVNQGISRRHRVSASSEVDSVG